MPKFRKKKPDLSKPVNRWMVFIEESPEEVLDMVKKEEPAIAKADRILEELGSYDEIKRYYEAREKAIHDEVSRITEAEARGITKGKAEGITEGELKNSIKIAKKLLNVFDDRTITEITGLPVEDVAKLRL